MKKLAMLMALCLVLPVTALAVQEGVVEEAPVIEIQLMQEEPELAQTEQLMDAYQDRAREILTKHLGCSGTLLYRYHQMLNASHMYDADGNVSDGYEAMEAVPTIFVKFYHGEEMRNASVWFDQRTGKMICAMDALCAPALQERGEQPLDDSVIVRIAEECIQKTHGIRDYSLFGDILYEGDGEYARVRVLRENGDMLGVRMNAYTGEVYSMDLYGLGEEREYAEYESRAQNIIRQAFGHEDMPLLSAQKIWYIPAAFDAVGVASYEAKAREGVEVRFIKYAYTANFSYEADVLFDLETGEAVRAGVSYDFSNTKAAVNWRHRRISGNDFGLRMAQTLADDYLSKWNKSAVMTVSPKSDAQYGVCHGLVDGEWRFEFTMNRETGDAVRHEFLRGTAK